MLQNSKILVIGPSWVGDMVMAQSLFKVLKHEQPNVMIDVLAPTWSEGLLQRMPEVHQFISHTIQHGQLGWQERRRIGSTLQLDSYQQAIVLPNSWKSALIPFWANIPRRTGYRGEMRYGLLNDVRKKQHTKTVEQFAALGVTSSIKSIPQPRLLPKPVAPTLQGLHLDYPQVPILALCPGAEYGPAKCWPLEYYATCAQEKIREGWQVWILGSKKDIPIAQKIQALTGCLNLCGQTSLPEAVDLLSLSTAVITNDSGLMHVVAALDKPLIALYGSSSPKMTPPLSDLAHIVSLELACSPCYQRTCPKQHLKCLQDITPERVLEILKQISHT